MVSFECVGERRESWKWSSFSINYSNPIEWRNSLIKTRPASVERLPPVFVTVIFWLYFRVFSCKVAIERTPFYGCWSYINHNRYGFFFHTFWVWTGNTKYVGRWTFQDVFWKSMNNSGLYCQFKNVLILSLNLRRASLALPSGNTVNQKAQFTVFPEDLKNLPINSQIFSSTSPCCRLRSSLVYQPV